MRKKGLLSLQINTARYSEFIDCLVELALSKKSHYACFANVHMLMEAHSDPAFKSMVNMADMVTPDGKALCWAMHLLYGARQDRVAGMDVLPDMLLKAEQHGLPVFFYGNSEKTLKLTKEYLQANHPGLILAGFISPPFRQLTTEEEASHIRKINQSGARIVFVCLGCPKQEKWMALMGGRTNTVMLGIGGALAVMIGIKKRAPKWIQHYGLEWLYRLKQEPSRLFRRYASTNPIFIYLICKEFIRIKILSKI
jgi:N-acetylglucosaminyldiphosphoundecaprenol N-acetyl-beta-D-mannosaminyltransferase